MTDVNIPLLRKAVEWAEAEALKPPPLREWEQNWWVLTPEKRAECLAYADDAEYYTDAEMEAYSKAPECGTCYCIAGFIAAQMGSTETGFGVEDIAADALDIGRSDAAFLFDGKNSIEDVRRIAEEIAGERL